MRLTDLPVLSLKGSHKTAQGNALGNCVTHGQSPARAQQAERFCPFSAAEPWRDANPGRCPGLSCLGLSGLESRVSISFDMPRLRWYILENSWPITGSAAWDTANMLAWDDSHDWVLLRMRKEITRVTIRFDQERPSLAELAAVRRSLPQFRDSAPATLKEKIGDSGMLPLGAMPTVEARRLIEAVQSAGLQVVAESESFVGYLPQDRTAGSVLLIEDAAKSAEIMQAMMAAGIPVEDVEP